VGGGRGEGEEEEKEEEEMEEKKQLGMAVHTYNPSNWKAEAGGLACEFQASLGYVAKLCFKTSKQTNKTMKRSLSVYQRLIIHFEIKLWSIYYSK
jgi:hypothetical protein